MPRITISYRREDSGVIAGRIFDRLVAQYGRESIFRDIDNIPLGVDFRVHINEVLSQSDIVLALVGPRWIGTRGGQGRLGDESDPVRVEIEAALRTGLPLIPVLVLGANMPRVAQLPNSLHDFAYRNALRIDASQDFDVHMSRLTRAIDTVLKESGKRVGEAASATTEVPETSTSKRRKRLGLGLFPIALLLGVTLIGWYFGLDRQKQKAPTTSPTVAQPPPPAIATPVSPPAVTTPVSPPQVSPQQVMPLPSLSDLPTAERDHTRQIMDSYIDQNNGQKCIRVLDFNRSVDSKGKAYRVDIYCQSTDGSWYFVKTGFLKW